VGTPADDSKYKVAITNPTKSKIEDANAGLCSLVPKPPFNAAITGIPKPAISINDA
jgi:hypothetical protein